jgi:hypothetical protein
MQKLMSVALIATAFFTSTTLFAQKDKSKRPSPPAVVTKTLSNGAVVTIDYSQPSIKGRSIGTELAPYGKVWRTGANEATTFETSKDLTIKGNKLPAGKYSIYSIPAEKEWTIIFNKKWDQWGTVYNESEDLFRFTVEPVKNDFSEKMTFDISEKGMITWAWGDLKFSFKAS